MMAERRGPQEQGTQPEASASPGLRGTGRSWFLEPSARATWQGLDHCGHIRWDPTSAGVMCHGREGVAGKTALLLPSYPLQSPTTEDTS